MVLGPLGGSSLKYWGKCPADPGVAQSDGDSQYAEHLLCYPSPACGCCGVWGHGTAMIRCIQVESGSCEVFIFIMHSLISTAYSDPLLGRHNIAAGSVDPLRCWTRKRELSVVGQVPVHAGCAM